MNPQLYENYPRFIHTLCRGSYSSPQGQLPGKYQTEIFLFFIFPPFHLGSCLGNFRGQSGYFFNCTYSLRFFFSSSADIKYYRTIFCLLFSPPTSMDGQRNFFPSLHRASEKYYEFCCLRTFFSSYVFGWTEKEKIFPQNLHGVCEKYYENIFCLRIFFLLLHLWMNRRRRNFSTDFAQSVWEFTRF